MTMEARGVPPVCSEKCGLNARVPGEAGSFANTCNVKIYELR